MPFKNDLVSLLDEGFRSKTFSELAACPAGILAGLSHTQAARMMEALGARTIAEVAANRYVLWAQSITQLAPFEKVDGFNPSLSAILHARFEKMGFRELVKQSPAAFTGIGEREARLLEEGIGVRTIEDLATNRHILLAQVIWHLARYEKPDLRKKAA